MANLTQDDISKISQECLQDKDFISRFQNAVDGREMPDPAKDPEGHAKFLEDIQGRLVEMAMKEKQGEVYTDGDGTWGYTLPEGVFCIKAADVGGGKKVFINICRSEAIQEPMPMTEGEVEDSGMQKKELQFRVPISIGPCRVENDKAGKAAAVYDIAVNPLTLEKCEADYEFKRLVCAMCLYGLKQKHEPNLDTDQYKQPNLKCKGQPVVQRVRLTRSENKNAFNDEIKNATESSATHPAAQKRPSIEVIGEPGGGKPPPGAATDIFYEMTKDHENGDAAAPDDVEVDDNKRDVQIVESGVYDWGNHTHPELNSYWRARVGVPGYITVKIHLPEVECSIAECTVDVQHSKVAVFSCDDEGQEAPYVEEGLRFPVDEEDVVAKFGRKKKVLTLKLRVKLPDELRQKAAVIEKTAEDDEAEERLLKEQQEQDSAHAAEQRAKFDRKKQEELDQQQFNKNLVDTAKAMQAGTLPPELQEMISSLPPNEAKTMLGRLVDGQKRGDAIDPILEKLPPEALQQMIVAIREKLGLAPMVKEEERKSKKEEKQEKKKTEDEDDDEEHTFGFHKMSKKLFGVDIQNRFLFALDL